MNVSVGQREAASRPLVSGFMGSIHWFYPNRTGTVPCHGPKKASVIKDATAHP